MWEHIAFVASLTRIKNLEARREEGKIGIGIDTLSLDRTRTEKKTTGETIECSAQQCEQVWFSRRSCENSNRISRKKLTIFFCRNRKKKHNVKNQLTTRSSVFPPLIAFSFSSIRFIVSDVVLQHEVEHTLSACVKWSLCCCFGLVAIVATETSVAKTTHISTDKHLLCVCVFSQRALARDTLRWRIYRSIG